MKVRARVTDPTTVEITMQVSMTVAQWGLLRGRLQHPAASHSEVQFRDAIERAVARVTAVLEEEADVTEEKK